MSSPVTGNWKMFANGFPVDLFIQDSKDPTKVVGEIIENNRSDPLTKGTWNDTLKEIKFTRKLTAPDANNPVTGPEVQDYIGFLFDRTVKLSPASGDTFVMAGTFTSTGGFENPVKQKAGWGWFAFFGVLQPPEP
jgi:hypothetical protein